MKRFRREEESEDLDEEDDDDEDSCWARGIIVLFVKQVHLQNDGGDAATARLMRAQRKSRIELRRMVLAMRF